MPNGHYANSEYIRNRKKLVYATWRHKRRCWICGLPFKSKGDITADHVIPICLGGTHAYSNLKPAHSKCNSDRGHGAEDNEDLSDPGALLLGVRVPGERRIIH